MNSSNLAALDYRIAWAENKGAVYCVPMAEAEKNGKVVKVLFDNVRTWTSLA